MTIQIAKYFAIFIVSIIIGGFVAHRYYKPAIDSLEAEIREEREMSRQTIVLYNKQIDTLNNLITEYQLKRKVTEKKLSEIRGQRNYFDTSYNKNFIEINDYDSLIEQFRTIYK